jgi:hypothetical protein
MNVTQPAFRMHSSFEKEKKFPPWVTRRQPTLHAPATQKIIQNVFLHNISPPISGAPEIAVSPSIYDQNAFSWQRATRDFSLDK